MVKKLQLKEADIVVDYNNLDYEEERSHDWALKNKDIAFDKVANIISKSLFVVDDEDDVVIFIDNVVDKLPAELYVYSDISPARWKITFTNDGRFITEPTFESDCIITVADDHLIKESQSLLNILKQLTFWYGKIK